jgi:hypothetical protein
VVVPLPLAGSARRWLEVEIVALILRAEIR